ncbi:cyclin-dependent kinase 2-interacting protein isoform X1 [Electrophorus electricus]|uniref:cyclin-dependent kinase 2-interacting protein isoform X1 n=1 Tax=Electrophorus electricus TaxID=8005 RepID=UPI0015CFAE3E|nr:cyclin-dependent kinase 2-interacting protein isoform X1 [Electrophorus electricus]
MNDKYSETTTPARKGNLTGSARKLKDNAADWHNLILKWDRLNEEGSSVAAKIVNSKISKDFLSFILSYGIWNRSLKEHDVLMEGDHLSVAPSLVHQNSQELQAECTNLQNIVNKMAHILSKMEKMVSAGRGMCELEKFQYGAKGRPAPLFQTWSMQQFAEVSSRLYDVYKQELALKQTILQELAHTTNMDLSMVYLSSWLYQPYIEDSSKLLLESLLIETGHRAL